jgi:hypothetical protein
VSIVATGATLFGAASGTFRGVYVDNQNDVTIRGLTVSLSGASTGPDVYCNAPPGQMSRLTVRAMTLTSGGLYSHNCQVVVRESDLHAAALVLNDGSYGVVDRARLSGVYPRSSSTLSLTMTNSIVSVLDLSMLTQPANASLVITYNTFVGQQMNCSYTMLPSGIMFVDNIFYSPATGVDAIAGAGCIFDTNIAFPQTASIGLTTIKTDPLFVGPTLGDYHVKVGSPAIGAARPTGSDPTVDFAGTPRSTTAPTIGAYEYKQ